MPKVKAKRVRCDSDEEYEDTHTQAGTSTQYNRQLASLSEDSKQAKVNDLVQYLLIQDQKKIPIKKQDISKHVLHEHSKLLPMFMEEAEKKLREVFGIEVVTVEKQKQQKCYILVSLLGNDTNDPYQTWSEEENAKLGLIMVILGMIFMHSNIIADSILYHALRKLGVDIEQMHDVFGDVRKLLTGELVRQGWLEYQRQGTGDPPAYDYTWGLRAKAETTRRQILDFVCQVYTNMPKDWTSQYLDVQRHEPEETNNNAMDH